MNYTLKKYILLIFLFIFLIPDLSGDDKVIKISEGFTSRTVTHYLSCYIDQNNLNFNSILKLGNWQWESLETDNIIINKNLWFTVTIHNDSNDIVYFVINNPKINEIDFYFQDETGAWHTIQSGTNILFAAHEIKSPFFVFYIRKSPVPRQCYFRVRSQIPLTLDARIFERHEFHNYNMFYILIRSLFVGILLFAIIYNIFLFITTKEKQFIALALYVIGWLGLHLYLDSFGIMFLWQQFPLLEKYGLFIFTPIIGIGGIFFLRHYLGLKRDYLIFDRILYYGFLPFCCISLISIFFLPISVLYIMETIRGGMQTIFTFYIAIYTAIKKNKNAYFFLLAYFIIPFHNIFLILIAAGVIAMGFFSKWSGVISTAWLVTFLSFGVGYKYHRMQKQAQQSEERYRLLNDSIMEGFFIADITGKFIETNKTFQNMLGYSHNNLIKLKTTDITPQNWYKTDMLIMESQVVKRGYSDVYEKEYKTSGNNLIRVELRKYVIMEKNNIKGVWAIVRDITEKHRLHKQLIQAQKMDTIGQLAGGIAHDLNNILGGIYGFAEILRDTLDQGSTEKNQGYIKNIIQITRKAAELNNQLLSFSRKADMIKINFDIHTAIDEVILILERTIDKKIKIKKEYNAEKHTIYGDVIQVQNAVLNLAINARDAMPKGGTITFMTRNLYMDEGMCHNSDFDVIPGNYIEISISDTGCGIPEQIKDKIFEPFFTTKETGKGTGLGLPAVYGTVKEHNGAVTVYSELDTYTAFNIYFLLYEGELKIHKENQKGIIIGSGTILIGEDDKALQLVFRTLLEQFGYNSIIMQNGKETLNYYKDHYKDIDLVLMDIIMPEFNGVEVYEKMKKINPKVKVILCSGYSSGYNISELLKSGVKYFIKKPFSGKNLSQIIYNALSEEPVSEKNILFVDDEEIIVNTSRDFLSTIGHTISGFTNPGKALEYFKVKPEIFDIAVIDNLMPEMNGLELSEELLKIRPNFPIILSTGQSTPELETETQKIGIKHILKKPYTIASLLEVMK